MCDIMPSFDAAWLQSTRMRVRYVQRRMLCLMPVVLFFGLFAFLVKDLEPRAFYIAPSLQVSAVRSVLLREGMHEG